MCGIAGLIANARSEVIEERLLRMKSGIRSRGPDGTGYYVHEGVGLLNTRLAVIDLTGGDQPVWNEDSSVACVFNGEIYNYRELRGVLAGKRHVFKSDCDTEVLVHAYEEWGTGMVTHLRGMFAFAIHDHGRRRLLLARDRLGIKPLYLAQVPGGWAFASTISSLLDSGADSTPNLEALRQYFQSHKIAEPQTANCGVTALLPGHILDADLAGSRQVISRYYRPTVDVPAGSVDESIAVARRAFESGVKRHLHADVEVAAFLSGGIDSSLVVAEAQRLHSRPLRTFSAAFTGMPTVDESDHAERVAAQIGTAHETIEILPPTADTLTSVLDATSQPFGVASFMPMLLLATSAAKHVKVVLTGDGGDELGLGYPWHRWTRLTVPPIWGQRVGGSASRQLLRAERAVSQRARSRLLRRGLRFARGIALGGAQGADAWRNDLTTEEANVVLHKDLREEGFPARRPSPTETAWIGSGLHALWASDLEVLLRDEMLPKLDRAGMAVGLEGRVPLLDDDFVEKMLSIPASEHLGHRQGKAVLRSWAQELVPDLDIVRPKHGFDVPMAHWLGGSLKDEVERLLLRPISPGLVDPDQARLAHQRMTAGVPGAAHSVYAMLLAALWFERS